MKRLAFLLALCIPVISCDKDDPEIPNEEELITTLTYTLTPSNGGNPVVLSFKDLDGDGGNTPIISGGILAANQTYTGALQLLNETESPVDNITAGIEEESDEHQFFFKTTVNGLSIAYNDRDPSGNPVGLNTTLTTGAAGSGTLTVTLRHEPNKSAAGVSSGDITNAGGETDIEVTFGLEVL